MRKWKTFRKILWPSQNIWTLKPALRSLFDLYAQMKDIFLPVAARDDGGMLGRDPPPLVPWVPFMWDSGVGAYAEDTLTGLTIGVPKKN